MNQPYGRDAFAPAVFFPPHVTKLDVVYEDNHLLVVNKPAGIATQGAEPGRPSLLHIARQYIKHKYNKPGNVYLGTVSRLDAAVSGVVVFARTSKAAARLSEQFRRHTVHKVYWAAVSGNPSASAVYADWLVKDESQHRMRLADEHTLGAQFARLSYRRLRPLATGWLLEITLETGRKHQIRCQLAARGLPILGDRKYGSRNSFPRGIALHARMLQLAHPTRGETISLEAEPPVAWHSLGLTGGWPS